MANYDWLLLPALASGALCLLLVPLGYQVIRRGVIFADLAIAQSAALGALIGSYWLTDMTLAGASLTSLIFALLGALLVELILRYCPEVREAWIGILYVVAASLAVLLVSGDPHGAQALQRTAAGDLLWAQSPPVIMAGMLALLVWLILLMRPQMLAGACFMPLFALAVSYAVALAGVYVVFATLIITPLILGTLQHQPPVNAAICAFAGHLLAIMSSLLWDLPVGPTLVVASLMVAGLCVPFCALGRRFRYLQELLTD